MSTEDRRIQANIVDIFRSDEWKDLKRICRVHQTQNGDGADVAKWITDEMNQDLADYIKGGA